MPKKKDIDAFLSDKQTHLARLFPALANNQREKRIVSIFLAILPRTPVFRDWLLEQCEGNIGGSRKKLVCYTEVAFPVSHGKKIDEPQPDGVLCVAIGKKRWTALIEGKVGNEVIGNREKQLESYVAIANEYGIDAVITLSNQLATLPHHLPYERPKGGPRALKFFHISWASIKTQVELELDEEIDPHEHFLLKEFSEYLKDEDSGVKRHQQMNKEWGELVKGIQNGKKFRPKDTEVEGAVASWYQRERDICLLLRQRTKKHVVLDLSREHKNDAKKRLKDDCKILVSGYKLSSCFKILDDKIEVTADLVKRSISCSIAVKADDSRRSGTRVNKLLDQLPSANEVGDGSIIIWARAGVKREHAPLSDLHDPDKRAGSFPGFVPTHFEIVMSQDFTTGKKDPATKLNELVEEFHDLFQRKGFL